MNHHVSTNGRYRFNGSVGRYGLGLWSALAYGSILFGTMLSPAPIFRLAEINVTASDVLFFVSGLFLLLSGRWSYRSAFPIQIWGIGIALIVIGLILSSAHNGDPDKGLIVSSQYAFAYILVFWLIINQTRERLLLLLKINLFSIAGVCVIGIAARWLFPGSSLDITVVDRMGSLLENPNRLGKMVALASPMLLGSLSIGIISARTAFGLGMILGLGVLFSGSIGGLLSALFGTVTYLILAPKTTRSMAAVGTLALVGMFLVLSDSMPVVFERRVASAFNPGTLLTSGSAETKSFLMRKAWDDIQSSPFIGIGAAQSAQESALRVPVHNTALILWLEGGIASAAGWVLILATGILYCLFRMVREDRVIGAMGAAVVLTFLVATLTNPHSYSRHWVVPIAIVIGLAGQPRSGRTSTKEPQA